ncbi:expressed unknown protein [Seminavis robusta]|uniref:Uncharacterized protein n=1 Tax=Seminavis robusta TaxID=568900 RepID=A0A9N8DEX5_9STRA|nr:expressed unknown protein [Seminavis robusta]|eukprot:Sro108_g054290.1 n/a (828) ;mRNA; r:87578-90899
MKHHLPSAAEPRRPKEGALAIRLQAGRRSTSITIIHGPPPSTPSIERQGGGRLKLLSVPFASRSDDVNRLDDVMSTVSCHLAFTTNFWHAVDPRQELAAKEEGGNGRNNKQPTPTMAPTGPAEWSLARRDQEKRRKRLYCGEISDVRRSPTLATTLNATTHYKFPTIAAVTSNSVTMANNMKTKPSGRSKACFPIPAHHLLTMVEKKKGPLPAGEHKTMIKMRLAPVLIELREKVSPVNNTPPQHKLTMAEEKGQSLFDNVHLDTTTDNMMTTPIENVAYNNINNNRTTLSGMFLLPPSAEEPSPPAGPTKQETVSKVTTTVSTAADTLSKLQVRVNSLRANNLPLPPKTAESTIDDMIAEFRKCLKTLPAPTTESRQRTLAAMEYFKNGPPAEPTTKPSPPSADEDVIETEEEDDDDDEPTSPFGFVTYAWYHIDCLGDKGPKNHRRGRYKKIVDHPETGEKCLAYVEIVPRDDAPTQVWQGDYSEISTTPNNKPANKKGHKVEFKKAVLQVDYVLDESRRRRRRPSRMQSWPMFDVHNTERHWRLRSTMKRSIHILNGVVAEHVVIEIPEEVDDNQQQQQPKELSFAAKFLWGLLFIKCMMFAMAADEREAVQVPFGIASMVASLVICLFQCGGKIGRHQLLHIAHLSLEGAAMLLNMEPLFLAFELTMAVYNGSLLEEVKEEEKPIVEDDVEEGIEWSVSSIIAHACSSASFVLIFSFTGFHLEMTTNTQSPRAQAPALHLKTQQGSTWRYNKVRSRPAPSSMGDKRQNTYRSPIGDDQQQQVLWPGTKAPLGDNKPQVLWPGTKVSPLARLSCVVHCIARSSL